MRIALSKISFTKLSEKNKLLLLSLLVGILSGLSAVVLTSAIHLVKTLVDSTFSNAAFNWEYLIFPGLGMLISLLLLKFVVRDNISHGVTKVLLAVSQNDSKIEGHNTWSSILTSAVTIGLGGSVGAEAPIVYTGAAIGSNIGSAFNLSYRNITILLGCGAAGAIAGIFKAPLAGIIFTMEILLFNISMSSLLPLLVSAMSATVVSYIFTGLQQPFQCTLTPFSMLNIPFYILLGIFCGFCSLYFLRMTLSLEDRLGKMQNPYLKWLLCAFGLGLLIFLFPQLYGEGYDSLHVLLNGKDLDLEGSSPLGFLKAGWGVPLFFLLVLLLKVFSMALTNAGGGIGGTFGPTLFVGAIAGFFMARTTNLILSGSGISIPEQNFVLVGMAGLMAGVMQAPMTAIFLIAEITGGYELFLPLIIVSTISFGTMRVFEKYSIYTKRIAQSGQLLTHDNDQAVLTLMRTKELIRDKYPRVDINASLRELAKVLSESTAAVFAVVDDENHFQGVIDVDVVRKYVLSTELYDKLHSFNLMENPPEFVYENEKMDSVMRKFDSTNAWRLPVIREDRTYLGFISKSRILSAYRQEVKEISEE